MIYKTITPDRNISCAVYTDEAKNRYVLFSAGFFEGEEVIEDVYKVYECTSGLKLTEDTFTLLKYNTYVFDKPFCDLSSKCSLAMLDKGQDPVEYAMWLGV